ncbi:MAG: hypothetical protein Q9221_007447 [Calogaya cf. arnoldii]
MTNHMDPTTQTTYLISKDGFLQGSGYSFDITRISQLDEIIDRTYKHTDQYNHFVHTLQDRDRQLADLLTTPFPGSLSGNTVPEAHQSSFLAISKVLQKVQSKSLSQVSVLQETLDCAAEQYRLFIAALSNHSGVISDPIKVKSAFSPGHTLSIQYDTSENTETLEHSG